MDPKTEVGRWERFVHEQVQGSGENFFIRHHAYGAVPVRRLGSSFVCKIDFKPPLPPGAVRADVRRQNIQFIGDPYVYNVVPRYYYREEKISCIDCGAEETFTIEEQRQWYEVFRLPVYLKPSRCHLCREKIKSGKALSDAVARVKKSPRDPEALLQEAECRIELFELSGRGDLDKALGAIKRVPRASPHSAKAEALVGRIRALRSAHDSSNARSEAH